MEIDLYFQITTKDFVIFQFIRNCYILWWPYWNDVGLERNKEYFFRTIHRSFLQRFISNRPVVSKDKSFFSKISANQKLLCHLTAILDVKSK